MEQARPWETRKRPRRKPAAASPASKQHERSAPDHPGAEIGPSGARAQFFPTVSAVKADRCSGRAPRCSASPAPLIAGVTIWARLPMPIRIGPTSRPFPRIFRMLRAAPAAVGRGEDQRVWPCPEVASWGKMRARSSGVERAVDIHLALVGKAALLHLQDFQRGPHAPPAVAVEICRTGCPNTARCWAPPRNASCGAPVADHRLGRSRRGLGWAWICVSAMKSGPSSEDHQAQRANGMKFLCSKELADVVQVPKVLAEGAADHGIGLVPVDHDRARWRWCWCA